MVFGRRASGFRIAMPEVLEGSQLLEIIKLRKSCILVVIHANKKLGLKLRKRCILFGNFQI